MASNPRVSYKTAQNSPVEPSCRCGQGQPALGPRLEFSNLSVDRFQKRVVLRQIEYVLLNPRLKLASHEIFANLLQLLLRNQFEPNLIKITEEPRVLERARCHGRILDGQSAPQQLVTARGVHRVDAEVRPANANAIEKVRRMVATLASVLPRELQFRAFEKYSQSIGVIVHPPVGFEECSHVVVGEVVGIGVGSRGNADLPLTHAVGA
jgi:hypothetical protein